MQLAVVLEKVVSGPFISQFHTHKLIFFPLLICVLTQALSMPILHYIFLHTSVIPLLDTASWAPQPQGLA